MFLSQTAQRFIEDKILPKYYLKKDETISVDELCRRFSSKLHFGLNTFESEKLSSENHSILDFWENWKFDRFLKNIWTIITSFLVFLWFVSGFCVGLYVIQVYENREYVDYEEILLAVALIVSVAIIGIFTFYQAEYLQGKDEENKKEGHFPTLNAKRTERSAANVKGRNSLEYGVIDGQAASRVKERRQPAKTIPASDLVEEEDDPALTDECPEPNGFFADAYQCDKYYECRDGAITEKLCPDGMVFNDFSPLHEKCDLPFGIDCSQRPELQKPQPTLHCPRLNGYFAHEDERICDKFYYCVDGKFNMITCPSGLVYNEKTGICSWPDEAKKKGCSSQDVFQFSCPKVNESIAQTHPRYADPQDCQFFYVCINGEVPRRNGCKRGQVFSEEKKVCDWPRHVPECKDWYKDILTDEELEALENPKPKPKPSEEDVRRRNGGKKRPKHTDFGEK